MLATQVGNRYAKAIYEIANSKDNVKKVYEILSSLMELYKNDSEFKTIITHPLIDVDKKKKVIKDIFNNATTDELDIIYYILDKQRINYIRNIVVEYLKIYYALHKILDVVATFAVMPSNEQKEKLIKNLEAKTGKKIKLTVVVDKEIIGGGILKIGDTVIDGSIRHELENLRKN